MKGWSSDVARFDKTGLPDTAARRRQTALSADNDPGIIQRREKKREENMNEWQNWEMNVWRPIEGVPWFKFAGECARDFYDTGECVLDLEENQKRETVNK